MEHLARADTQPWTDESLTAEGHARLSVKVGGMHRSLCTGIIESTLCKQSGIHKVSVNLRNGQALIEYDRGSVGTEQLLSTVRDLGFSIGDSRAARSSSQGHVRASQREAETHGPCRSSWLWSQDGERARASVLGSANGSKMVRWRY